MSDSSAYTGRASQPLEAELHQASGVFLNEAALQDAVGRLTRAGFDRADIALPGEGADPNEEASVTTDDDRRQVHTLQSSLAATAGAFAASGAVIATGGLAAPAVAAALVGGIGAGGLAHAAGQAAERMSGPQAGPEAAGGTHELRVKARDATQLHLALRQMQEAGAVRTATISNSLSTSRTEIASRPD